MLLAEGGERADAGLWVRKLLEKEKARKEAA